MIRTVNLVKKLLTKVGSIAEIVEKNGYTLPLTKHSRSMSRTLVSIIHRDILYILIFNTSIYVWIYKNVNAHSERKLIHCDMHGRTVTQPSLHVKKYQDSNHHAGILVFLYR